MIEEHIAAGTITAKTYWGDYCQRVHLLALFLVKHIHISSSSRNDYSFVSVLICVYLLCILLLLCVYAYDTIAGQGF